MTKILCTLYLSALCAIMPARAQFTGDIFFSDPSLVLTEGEEGTLEIVLFSGDNPLGAAAFTLTFDPDVLEIVENSIRTLDDLDGSFLIEEGRVSGVVYNSTAIATPIGAVRLAELTVKPLASPGATIEIASNVSEILLTDRSDLPPGSGFSAEISVVDGVMALSTAKNGDDQPLKVEAASRLGRRAAKLRPSGQTVPLAVSGPDGALAVRQVQVESEPPVRRGREDIIR